MRLYGKIVLLNLAFVFWATPIQTIMQHQSFDSMQHDNAYNLMRKTVSEKELMAKALNRVSSKLNGLIVHNPKHEIEFSANGVELRPVSEAPNFSWKVVSQDDIIPVFRENKIVYERNEFREEYILKENTIEQQFVLDKPYYNNEGSLTISASIKCDGLFSKDGSKWVWKNDAGEVTLSNVYAFDKNGKTIPARMEVSATSTTIQVLEEDLSEAEFPITIDPEIGTNDFRISNFGSDGDGNQATNSAISFNSAANRYLVVWEAGPGGDFEIYGQFLDGVTGAPQGAYFQISDMGSGDANYDAFSPDITSLGNDFFVVWRGDNNANAQVDNEFEIFGRLIAATTGVLQNMVIISQMGNLADEHNPIYGASSPAVSSSATDYLVTWSGDDNTGSLANDEFEIYVQRISSTGVELGGDVRISDMGPDGFPTLTAVAPDIAWNSTNNQFLVTWYGDDVVVPLVDNELEIFMQQLTSSGIPTGSNDVRVSFMGPNGNTSYTVANPSIAYNSADNNYLIVWTGEHNAGGVVDGENEIYGCPISNLGVLGTMIRLSDMGPDGNVNYNALNPSVQYDNYLNQFLVAWQGDDNSTTVDGTLIDNEFEIYGQLVSGTGTEIGSDIRLSDVGGTGSTSRNGIRPSGVYNNTTKEHISVWEADDSDGGSGILDNEFEIFGQRFAEMQTEPTAQPTVPVTSSITSSSFSVSFNAATGPPDGYIVLRKSGSSVPPVDQTVYLVGNTVGTSTVVSVGSALSFNDSGLSAGTTYSYDIFSYNGINSSTNYRTTSPLQPSVTTLFAEPTTQSTFSFSSFGTTTIQVNLSAGNGSNRLLVAKAGSAVNIFPTDGNSYAPNNNISLAPDLGSGNFVVGSGTGAVTITGLSTATVYHFRMFEFNGTTTLTNYNTTAITNSTGSQSTLSSEPTAQPTAINFNSVTNNSYTLGFTAASGSPGGYIGIHKAGSAPANPADLPVDGTSYTVGNTIGGSTVAFVGNSTSFPLSSLIAATDYHFFILSYNGSGANINYRQTAPLAGNQSTFATPPVAQPSSILFSNLSTTTLDVGFTAATGSPSGYIALRKIGSSPTDVPVNGASYSVGNTIGSSTVAYVGATASFNDTGLVPNTIYHYDIFSFNGSGGTLNYFLASPLEGSRTTLDSEPTDQPESLVFGSYTTASLTGSFTAAVGNPAGYIVLGKTGSAPTETPADGATYTVGSALGSSVILNAGSSTTFNHSVLNAGTEYFYKVFAFNGSGAAINYFATNPLQNSAFTLPLLPESLDANQVSKNSFVARWNASVSATSYKLDVSADNFTTFITGYNGKVITGALDDAVSGLTPATSYKYRIRAVNSSGESQNSLEKSVTTLAENASSLLISTPIVTLTGTSYKIAVTLSAGSGTRVVNFFKRGILSTSNFESTSISSTTDIYEATVEASMLDELGIAYFFNASDATTGSPIETPRSFIYRLIDASNVSVIPFSSKLDGTSSTFEMFSIPYKLDKEDVPSVFKTEYEKTVWRLFHYQSENTKEYLNGFNGIEHGRGYWFNAKTKFDVAPGTGKVAEANQTKDFSISLVAGWNQIGNPYPFNIDWNQIKAANPLAGLNSLWFFENGQYVKKDVLAPWKGAFVFSDNGGTINFPVLSKTTSPGRVKENENSITLDEEMWRIPLVLQVGEISQVSGVGMHPDAKISKDQFDEITIPRFLNYLEMDTHHPEFFAPYFSTDIVPTVNSYNWQFTLTSNLTDYKATLSWNHEALKESHSEIAILDRHHQIMVDMKSVGSYEFVWREGMQFNILYSKEGQLQPGVTMLGQAYPNPFSTGVSFPLFLEGDQEEIEIGVYDMLGRKVKSILQHKVKAGIHEIEWDGNNGLGVPLKTGIYFYHLRGINGLRSQSRRIVKQ